jgi:serine protease inhibitor
MRFQFNHLCLYLYSQSDMKSIRDLLTRIRSKSPTLDFDDPRLSDVGEISKDLKPVLQKLKSTSKLSNQDPIGSLAMQLVKFYRTELPVPFAICPPAVFGVFVPLYLGSTGDTQILLSKYLDNADSHDLYDRFRSLIHSLKESGTTGLNYHLIYNGKLILDSKFSDRIKTLYSITPFTNQSNSQLVLNINNLIKQSTKGYMTQMVSHVDPSDSLMFVTTTYFNAKWVTAFDPKLTRETEFTGISLHSVSMMKQCGNCHMYSENSDYQLIEMSYQGYQYTMGILLPRKINPKLKIEGLTSDKLLDLIEQLKETTIDELQIPKFRIEHEFDLAPFCYTTGLGQIFQQAELSGCCPKTPEATVSKFIQKTIVQIDEMGIKASDTLSPSPSQQGLAGVKDKNKLNVIADHSFVFYIRHREMNIIVMIGIFQ